MDAASNTVNTATNVAKTAVNTTVNVTSAAVNVASHIDPSTATHIALGAASFMPVVGSAAAVADAGLYLYEGDPVSAALSLTAVVPGGAILAQGGRALKAVKGADKALTVVNEVNKTEKAIKGADEAVDVFNDVGKVEKAAKQAEEAERLATDASRAEKSADDAAARIKFGDTGGPMGTTDLRTGKITIQKGLRGRDLDETIIHESVHASTVRLMNRVGLGGLNTLLYKHSQTWRWASEALAEGVATRSARAGLRFPFHGYGVSPFGIVREIGTVAGATAAAWYLASRRQ